MNPIGKFQKSLLKSKKFLKNVEILFRVWKHIFGKNYFENQKIQVSKSDSNVLNFWQNTAEMVLKTDEADGKCLKICIKIKIVSDKIKNIFSSLETYFC